tara:strand:+ start:383 stop:628 length:246 start_codon:yes stop_codon:yes gene_type:complete
MAKERDYMLTWQRNMSYEKSRPPEDPKEKQERIDYYKSRIDKTKCWVCRKKLNSQEAQNTYRETPYCKEHHPRTWQIKWEQ